MLEQAWTFLEADSLLTYSLLHVDLGISIPKDNVATSSPKTVEPNAVANASGKNLGKDANPEAPAARSRFFLTLSRSVPGRPADQGTDSLAASGKLDVSPSTEPVNKDLCEHKALPVAAAPGQAADKTSAWTQTEDQALPTTSSAVPLTPELGAETPSRPKDFGFFDRIFKLDKGREKVPVDSQQQEGKRPDDPDNQDKAAEAPVVSANSHAVPEGEDTVVSEEREGQEVETLSSSITGDPEALETPKEDLPAADTTDNNNSIMSFFKTLVSPNKTETKKDPEDKTSNSTEKVPTPPEPTVTAQKAKESSSKDKKSAAEVSKQKSSKADAQEPAQCAQPAPAEASSLQNGDQPPKRRRQSRGGFLKGLGPKRMLDAQVQTDPVSIGPAGKSK